MKERSARWIEAQVRTVTHLNQVISTLTYQMERIEIALSNLQRMGVQIEITLGNLQRVEVLLNKGVENEEDIKEKNVDS